MTTDSPMMPAGVTTSSWYWLARHAMSANAKTVTLTMINACALIVRRACVPASDDFHASQNPVSAAKTDTAAPAMNTQVPACHSSRAHVWLSPPTTDATSKIAAMTYAAMGKSVSGGCIGLPDHPRGPLNLRPRSVSVGRNENLLMLVLLSA